MIIVVACSDRGAGNDPEALGLASGLALYQALDSLGVMIYLSQGGLRSLSALSNSRYDI